MRVVLYSHGLPPSHPCFLHVQPYPEDCLASANMSDDVDIESMTIVEYNLYVAKQGLEKNPLNDHSYGFTPYEHDVDNINDLEKEVAQVEDEDIEQIRQFLTPNIFDVMDDVIQPLILKTIHTTPPDNDYVAPATSSILDDLLEEFGNEILNVTMVDEGAECNPTKDIEELERLLAKDLQSYFIEIEDTTTWR
ncbi:hypothetical protein Tco_0105302 [Tanacetum coccineum]